jgi:DNA-binding transcriptional LysR family regulator
LTSAATPDPPRLPPALDLRTLRAFLVVAEELHFGRAASRLAMAQPPLSQLVRRLEEAVGHSLFLRDTRKVELTPAGRALVALARDLFARLDGGLKHVQSVGRGEAGRLVVGFTPTVALHLLPLVVRRFRDVYPAVEVGLFEMLPDPLHDALSNRSIDVAMLREPSTDSDARIIPLFNEPFVAALPATHHLADKADPFDLSSLRGEPFVLFPHDRGSKNLAKILALCAEASFLPRVVQEVPGWQTAISMVGAGIGVSILPESVTVLHLPGVVYRRIDSDIQSAIALMIRPDDDRPMIENFVQSSVKLMGG